MVLDSLVSSAMISESNGWYYWPLNLIPYEIIAFEYYRKI